MIGEDPDLCPHCGVDLRYEANGYTYSRKEGHEIRGVYDGVLFYACPDCKGRWHRWSAQGWERLYLAAEPYVRGEK